MLSNGSNAHLARRRGFLLASAMGVAWCGHATANTGARRIGVLAPSTAAREALTLKPFFDEMARLGWTEPTNAQYDRVYADDRYQDLPRLARALVLRQPELIFAPPLPAAVAARQATRDIPIVFATGTDPVGAGLVDSLARPGGNATGMISVIESLTPKSLGLVLELIPGMRRVGLLADVMGMTGQAIIRAIVAGERDATVLALYRNVRVKPGEADIARALVGNWREEHLFVLAQALAMYDDIQRHLDVCVAEMQALMSELGASKVDLGRATRAGSKARADFDLRQMLANWAGVDLTRINGLAATTVLKLLSEIGPDLTRFGSVKHFCSWLGSCPGTKISGGKVLSSGTKRAANRARQALKLAAQSLWHSDSALGAFYRRLSARMDKPRANTATAHKLARMVYFMLTRGEAFVDQGQQRYEEQQRQRSIAALKRRAADMGFNLIPATASSAAGT